MANRALKRMFRLEDIEVGFSEAFMEYISWTGHFSEESMTHLKPALKAARSKVCCLKNGRYMYN